MQFRALVAVIMSLIAMGVAGALGGSSTAAAAVVGGHDQAGGRAMIRIAAMRLLSVRGGARVDVTRRKKKHLGLKVMIKSFVKSMFDPAFGRDDLADATPVSTKNKLKGGKRHKLGSIAGDQMSFGGGAGPVCGPNGC